VLRVKLREMLRLVLSPVLRIVDHRVDQFVALRAANRVASSVDHGVANRDAKPVRTILLTSMPTALLR
jgi:hypothetical protein